MGVLSPKVATKASLPSKIDSYIVVFLVATLFVTITALCTFRERNETLPDKMQI